MSKYIPVSQLSQEALEAQRARKRVNSKKYRDETPEYADVEQKRNYERHGKEWALGNAELVMVDGEADDTGHYNLFQAYSPILGVVSLQHSPTDRLGLFDCTQFMHTLQGKVRFWGKGKKTRFLYFAGGYDISQQLYGEKRMTPEEQAQAWHMRSRAWGAVRGPEWTSELMIPAANAGLQIGRKSGYVSFYPTEQELRLHPEAHARRVSWSDMFTLFNTGLVKAVEEYAKFWTLEEHTAMDGWLDAVKLGKDARGQWEAAGYSEAQIAEKYQEPELRLMHWLASKVIELCKEVGLYPKTLAGPAPIARALMHKYGATAHIKPKDYDTREFQEGPIMRTIRRSFFGGNIQSCISGYLPRGYHIYDINSAHPSHIKNLPCGAHGYWRDISPKEIAGNTVLPHAIYHIKWQCPLETRWGPFPVRLKKGETRYPLEGEGWYCSPEIEAFIDCYDSASYDLLDGIQWVSTCRHVHPFEAMVQETYDARQEYKKNKHPAGNILKLALNSSFGVLAQTHGSHRIIDEKGETTGYETPKLSNLFLASLVTSGTRANLMRLTATDPHNVFALATDAVKCYREMPISSIESEDRNTDRELGGLEHEMVDDPSYIVAPGVIAHSGGHDKYRGVPSKSTWWSGETAHSSMFDALDYASKEEFVTISAHFDEYQNPYSAGTEPGTEGQFIPAEREMDSTVRALRTKRDTLLAVAIGERLWYCPPYWASPDGASRAYMRPMDHGASIVERMEEWVQ